MEFGLFTFSHLVFSLRFKNEYCFYKQTNLFWKNDCKSFGNLVGGAEVQESGSWSRTATCSEVAMRTGRRRRPSPRGLAFVVLGRGVPNRHRPVLVRRAGGEEPWVSNHPGVPRAEEAFLGHATFRFTTRQAPGKPGWVGHLEETVPPTLVRLDLGKY